MKKYAILTPMGNNPLEDDTFKVTKLMDRETAEQEFEKSIQSLNNTYLVEVIKRKEYVKWKV